MNTYCWNAQDYDKNSQAQHQWAKELLAGIDLTRTSAILDLGCGDGKITAEIARLVGGGTVIGIDNAAQMIELAKQKYAKENYPNLGFQVMDAGDLAFDGCFDLAFSNAVLHWVKRHEPVVKGLYKSLRPGGKILLRMGGQGDAQGMISAMDAVRSMPEWKTYFNGFEFPYTFASIEEYRVLLTASGFKAKRVELVPKDMTHTEKQGLAGWIRTTWLPYTERVPSDQREKFIDQVCDKYLAEFPLDTDGRVHVAMMLLEVEAEKPANQ